MKSMEFSTIDKGPVYYSQTFRTPFSFERSLGLWVDRIGESRHARMTREGLRVLGLHALVLVVEGEGRFVTERCGEQAVRSGDCMLLFPREPHTYRDRGGWFVKWINFGGSEADLLLEAGLFSPSQPVVTGCAAPFESAFGHIAAIMQEEDCAAALERKALMLNCLHAVHSRLQENYVESRTGGRLASAIDTIGQRFADPRLSIPALAKQCHLSVTHFRRLFKDRTGRSPSQYILSLKISAAKKHLAEGLSIKETAHAIGVKDEFYFMRLFKKHAGITAGAFAREVIPGSAGASAPD